MKSDSTRDARITRWQIAVGLLVLLVSAAWVVDAVFRDPQVPFLTRAEDPDWITPYVPIDTDGIRVDLAKVPAYTFVKHFNLDAVPPRASVRLRAPGEAQLRINDEAIWRSDPARSWKRESERDVAAALRAGDNEVRVRVANPRGPALLQLRLEDAEGKTIVESNATWRAIDPHLQRLDTMRATDTRPDPQSFTMPSTGEVLVERAGVLGLFFALGAVGYLALRRSLPEVAIARAPEAVLAGATLFWVAVYVTKSSQLPVLMGFDIVGHLAYIDFLVERRALPLATDGWSMYHPPLGHAAIAGLVALFDLAREDAAARWLYRLPTFLAGLTNVWAVWFAARLLLRNDPLRVSFSVGFAALLPMNLYMSAYVSNEPVHSALVSAALCVACGLLVRRRTPAARIAALSATLGLAILTKFTALMVVPLAALFLALKMWLVDRVSWLRAAAVSAAMLVGVAGIAGWVYLRNWRLLGRPVVGNWDLPGNLAWWEQPGFHTLDYYTSFGQALSYPFFAGYASFWDGVYSTFWGDGLAAGMLRLTTRHEAWSYDFMTAGYWLAFPATLLLFVGFGRCVRFCLTGDDLGRRLAMSLFVSFLYAAAFALFAITFALPYYAQAKAFYILSAVVPLSIVAGLGLAWALERLPDRAWPLRMLYCGWLSMLAGSLVLAFLG